MSYSSECYLGIDPGLVRTGYAVLKRTASGPSVAEGGIVSSDSEFSLAERVTEIGQGVREVIQEFKPQILVIEQVFSLAKNPKSALKMAHARGAIIFVATELGVPVVHYTPTQIKRQLTGSGRADKEQMQEAIMRELNLDKVPEPHDVADAMAIALCHYHNEAVSYTEM